MSFTIDTSALKDWIARLEKAKSDVEQVNADITNTIAEITVELLSEASPYDSEPNNGLSDDIDEHLKDSYSVNEADASLVAESGVMTSQSNKLLFVTEGTRDIITPVTASSLWLPTHPVRAVHGQQANDFVTPVRDDVETEVPNIVNTVMGAFLQTLG